MICILITNGKWMFGFHTDQHRERGMMTRFTVKEPKQWKNWHYNRYQCCVFLLIIVALSHHVVQVRKEQTCDAIYTNLDKLKTKKGKFNCCFYLDLFCSSLSFCFRLSIFSCSNFWICSRKRWICSSFSFSCSVSCWRS